MNRWLSISLTVVALATASFAQSMSTNWKHGSDRTRCEDLQVTSSDYELARAEQEFTIDAKSVQQVAIDGSKNGGVYISGWDQPTYQVSACKVGFGETEAEASQVLAGINVANSAGHVTASGPDEKHWVIHFIIRVPHNANITASTYNGPVSVRDADGRVDLHSHNGPLSVKHFNGSATGETQNGPVDFVGRAGNISLTTQNGPLNLRLETAQYSGDLVASTTNGPVSLHLPDNFTSGFVVQGGYGPMSCSSSLCEKANQTGGRGSRRIEYGDSPKVKASTHNGPVSITGNAL